MVGHDWLRKNKVGNLLLGRDAFEADNLSSPERNHNTVFTGYMPDQVITVANTAELFASDLPDHLIKKRVKECASLCAPGPHALVLVISQGFDHEKRRRMEVIMNFFSDQAFQHSIVFIYKDHKTDKQAVQSITKLCGGRTYHYTSKSGEQTHALKAIEDMISKKNWSVMDCELFEDAVEAADMTGNGNKLS